MSDSVKTVSVGIVAYNEARYLPRLLKDIQMQSYPHDLMEIILTDSGSTDGTKKIMQDFADRFTKQFLAVRVVDNPGKIQASGWNQVLMAASCDAVIRIDAHAHIPGDFVKKNMRNLQKGEFISGGPRPCLCEDRTAWKSTLLQAENSLFGSSFGRARDDGAPRYVKTLFHAAYRKSVFGEVGGFNENLLRTEDNELHYRMRQAGYRFYCDPEIISYQYARSSLKKMMKQKYGNGYWVGLTLGVCPGCVSLYNFVPFGFLIGIILTTALCFFHIWQLAAFMWGLYGFFCIMNTVLSCRNGCNRYSFLMPVLFLLLHISYGIGTMTGCIQIPFKCRQLKRCDNIQKVKQHCGKGDQ